MKELILQLEKALTELRYTHSTSHAERRRARLCDVTLLSILERLDRRISRLEEGAGL